MNRTVLVTGSAGMVGSHLVEHLRAAREPVVATYLRPTIPADEVDRLQPLVELDVRDAARVAALIAEHRPVKIFHLAAQSYPTVCADRTCRVGDIVGIIEGVAGRKLTLVSDPALFRPTDEPIIFGDTTKLKQETGWAPTLTLAQTVERVFLYELRRRSGAAERLGSNL